MAQLYANPYGYDCKGFYFDSLEDYEKKYKANLHSAGVSPCEEYSIEFIDGSGAEAAVFAAMEIHQGTVKDWFEVEDRAGGGSELAALFWLSQRYGGGSSAEELLDKVDEVYVFEGDKGAYAWEFGQDVGIENADPNGYYFDYDSFGRDLRIDGYPNYGETAEEMGHTQKEHDDNEAYYARMSNQELGEEYVDSVGGVEAMGKAVENYFDYDALGRDMGINGDIDEFTFDGKTYVVTNAYEI